MAGQHSTMDRTAAAIPHPSLPAATQRLAPLHTPSRRRNGVPTPLTGRADSGMRMEIQALRALAVSLVVIYHVAPPRLTGGYVGVDVFFVVSGFLITAHLLREVERTDRVQLARFWARRARRLLPASLLVLVASAAAVVLWVPQTYWQGWLREIGASALYLENWLLAGDAVDYLAHTNAASPAQHYWSLSTEEQFYLAWPLLVALSAWVAVRAGAARRTVLAVLLGLLTAGSFAWSLWMTQVSPPDAYFTTPARAWEFGLGGLLALWAASPPAGRERLRSLVSWVGFGAIAYPAITYTGATPFPGTAALLPVLGTVAVIWAGAPRPWWSPMTVARLRPVRFLGDVSYSAYLWHWPLVVILPFALGHGLGTTSKIGILVVTVVAGWVTKVVVEDPLRAGTPLVRRGSGSTFLATAVATAVVVGCAAGGTVYIDQRVVQAREVAVAAATGGQACFGARATLPGADCADPWTLAGAAANPVFAKSDVSAGIGCLSVRADTELHTCHFGSPTPTETVALLGDSHTASLVEAMEEVAGARDWTVVTYLKAGCPALGSDRFRALNQPGEEPLACAAWSQAAIEQIAADPTITQVFTSYRSDIYRYRNDDGRLQNRLPEQLAQDAFRTLTDAGKEVVVIRAVPTTNGYDRSSRLSTREVSAPDCVAMAREVEDPCSGSRNQRLAPDQLATAALAMGDARVSVVDLTDAFCDPRRCHQVIGGVIVYFDGSHLTGTFSRTLGQHITARL